MRGHNICFHSEIRKIIFELSSILPLIWSSEFMLYTGGHHSQNLYIAVDKGEYLVIIRNDFC